MLFKLAFRNVMRQRRRSLLTLLSMGGGYLLLCLSLSLSEGSYNNIIDLFYPRSYRAYPDPCGRLS